MFDGETDGEVVGVFDGDLVAVIVEDAVLVVEGEIEIEAVFERLDDEVGVAD